jgi:hypothetical protein
MRDKFSNLLQTDCGQPTPASGGSLSKILPGKTPWLLGTVPEHWLNSM